MEVRDETADFVGFFVSAVVFCQDQQRVDPNVPTEFDVYWMVFLKKGPTRSQDPAEASRIQSGHLAHLAQQKRDGILLVAGPFEVEPENELRGIVLYPGDMPKEKVQAQVQADPAVQAGRLTVEIIKWWTPGGTMTFPAKQ